MTDVRLDTRLNPNPNPTPTPEQRQWLAAQDHLALWQRWMDMWNGDRAAADDILAPSLRVHLPEVGMPPADSIRTPRQFTDWIALFRGSYRGDARIATTLGPFAADGHLIGRWIFRGVWEGGRPQGASAPPGTPITLRGADILRVDESGRIAEYWLSDDLLDVYSQLGADIPAGGPAR
ncbi:MULTISPECIES: ester cyclase [unclassified Streptomyces]|uniref:ester cyclase n=1 Tax=unclassified Streptomyces TaxID=2593676 RepID=UPI0038179EF2